MALKRLTTTEMVSVTQSWVTKGTPEREALAAVPEAASLLPKLERAQKALLSCQSAGAPPVRRSEIQIEQKHADDRHDDVIRGTYYALTAAAFLAADAAARATLLALREVILPDGLQATQRTYREEAGAALMLKDRLTPAHMAQLRKVKILEGTVADGVAEWLRLGARLGELEDERGSLDEVEGATAAEALAARNQWIRVMTALRTNLELGDDVNPAVKKLMDRVVEVEQRAELRRDDADEGSAAVSAPARDADEGPA